MQLAKNKAENLKNGEVLLLENVRFHREETDNDPEFAKQLAGMAEIYVAILNAVGINSKVIGVESKGDVDGAIKEDGTTIDVPKIYDCSFKVISTFSMRRLSADNTLKVTSSVSAVSPGSGR